MLDTRTVEESYESSCNTTNLAVDPLARGAADWMIAAGWSDSRLGMALLRLRSEWESAEKPRKVSDGAIKIVAAEYKITAKEAALLADRWYANELRLLLLKLKTLKDVQAQMQIRAGELRVDHSAVGPVIQWWLSQSCKACVGHGKTVIPGTPTLSSHDCTHCKGTGKEPLQHGEAGRLLANQMDDCVSRAKQSLKGRFVHQRK